MTKERLNETYWAQCAHHAPLRDGDKTLPVSMQECDNAERTQLKVGLIVMQ